MWGGRGKQQRQKTVMITLVDVLQLRLLELQQMPWRLLLGLAPASSQVAPLIRTPWSEVPSGHARKYTHIHVVATPAPVAMTRTAHVHVGCLLAILCQVDRRTSLCSARTAWRFGTEKIADAALDRPGCFGLLLSCAPAAAGARALRAGRAEKC